MGKESRLFAVMAALMLALALVVATVITALTHGPGQLAMEADHAAWHAEQDGHSHATAHGHHDTADHDHTPTVILPAVGDLQPPAAAKNWTAQASQPSGTIRDGPRRPPRLI